jgi:hypothetical protein
MMKYEKTQKYIQQRIKRGNPEPVVAAIAKSGRPENTKVSFPLYAKRKKRYWMFIVEMVS